MIVFFYSSKAQKREEGGRREKTSDLEKNRVHNNLRKRVREREKFDRHTKIKIEMMTNNKIGSVVKGNVIFFLLNDSLHFFFFSKFA